MNNKTTNEFKKKIDDLRNNGYYNEAITLLNEALQNEKNDSWIWFALATNYDGLSNGKKALECLNEAIKIDPGRSSLYYGRGHVLAGLGEINLAIEDAKKAVQLKPEDTGYNNFLNYLLNDDYDGKSQLKLEFWIEGIELRRY